MVPANVRRRPPIARVLGTAVAVVALQSVVLPMSVERFDDVALALENDLTGVWSGNGPWSATTPGGITATATSVAVPTGGSFAFSGTQTLQSAFNGLPDPFPYSADYVPDHESFAFVTSWGPTITERGTLLFSFSEPVVDPILHLDRLGGSSTDTNGVTRSNGAVFEIVTPGATLTKLAGVDQLVVDATTFRRALETISSTSSSSCAADRTLGTACGSIQIAGTYTELEFEWFGSGPVAPAADGIEFTWELAGVPEISLTKTSDATAPLLDGDVVTYTIDIENIATAPALDIELADILPAGLVYEPESTVAVYTNTVATDTVLFSSDFEAGIVPWFVDNNGDATDVIVTPDLGSNRLLLRDNDIGAWRSVPDLTPYDTAELTFDFRRVSWENTEQVDIYVRADVAGESVTNANCNTDAAWTSIGSITRLQATDPTYQSATFVIPEAFRTATAGICLFTNGVMSAADEIYFDNITLTGRIETLTTFTLDNDPATPAAALADGTPDPGQLVSTADAIDLAGGDTLTLTYRARVDVSQLPPGATSVTNDVTFQSSNYPLPLPTTSTTDQLAVADLSLVKTDDGPTQPGQDVTYTITVSNAGPTPAVDTVVDDVLDANVTLVSVSSSQGGCVAFPCELGDIPDGGTATITVVATVSDTAPVGGTLETDVNEPGVGDCAGADLCNVATVTSSSIDWDTTDNADDEPTDVQIAVIEIDKTAAAPVDNGDGTFDVVYTVEVSNSGDAAGSYDLTDNISTGAGISSAVIVAPAYDASSTDSTTETPGALPGIVSGGTVDGGASDVFTYTVRFTVDPTAPVPDPCSVPDGNHAAENLAFTSTGATVSTCTDLAVPRLSLTKSLGSYQDLDGDGQVSAGDVLEYDFLVENSGNTTIDGIDVQDDLAGVTVSCPTTTLAAGTSTTCSGSYTVSQPDVDAAGVVNTATVTATPEAGVLPPVPPSTVTTPISQSPGIQLTKANISGSGPFVAGQTVTYRFTVVNTGDVSLDEVVLSDPRLTGATFTCDSTLAIGASTTCDVDYVVQQSDIDDGQISNTATVTANSPIDVAVADTDSELNVLLQQPQVDLVKTHDPGPTIDADSTGSITAGDTITYRFAVTNTGNVTLTGVGVDDPITGPATCPVTELAVGASTTCSVTYVVTTADAIAGSIENTATATASSPSGADTSDSDSDVTAVAAPPSISVSKGLLLVDGSSGNILDNWVAGDELTYEFVITNTGGVGFDPVTLDDTVIAAGDISCPSTTLAPGASLTCTGTYIADQDDVDAGTITNTATATGTTPNGDEFVDTSTHVASTTQTPEISIIKSVSGTPELGATLTYSFQVTNTGNIRLNGIAVSDPLLAAAPTCGLSQLDPGQSTVCTGTYVVQPADAAAGVIDNTAEASGNPITAAPTVTATDSLSTPVAQNPSIDLDKSQAITTDVAPVGVLSVDDVLTFTITIANDGDVPLVDVTFTDALLGYDAVPIDGAPCNGADTTLDIGETVTCTGTYVVTQPDIDAGLVNNAASTSSTGPRGGTYTATGATSIVAAQSPGIQTTKAMILRTDVDGSLDSSVGDLLTYTIAVENTGNVTLDPVTVVDPTIGVDDAVPIDDDACTTEGVGAALAPGESASCTFSYALTQADVDAGSIRNVATGAGQPPAGLDPVTDEGTVNTSLPAEPSLEIVKSLIAQSADPIGAGTELTYEFVVTNTGNVTLDPVTVDDDLIGSVTCGGPVVPGATTTCTAVYTVTPADVDAGQVVNTATASGQPPTPVGGVAPPPSESLPSTVVTPVPQEPGLTIAKLLDSQSSDPIVAGTTLTYAFVVTNTGNVTLTDVVVDDSLLGPVTCVASLAPGDFTLCTASYTVTQPDVDAGQVVNTATVTATPPPGSPPVPPTPPSEVTTPIASDPELTIDKALESNADEDGSTSVSLGDTLTYSFVVTNTGNVTITDIDVSDTKIAAVTCPVAALAPGETTTCTGTYTVTQPDVDDGRVFNEATATGSPPPASVPLEPATADHTEPITVNPSIDLAKSLASTTDNDGDGNLAAGDDLLYEFVVTNTGDVTLDQIVVDDPLIGAVSCPSSPLAPGVSTTCTGTYTVTQADVDGTSVENTATATGQPPTPVGGPVPAPVSSEPSVVDTPLDTVATLAVSKDLAGNADGDGTGSITEGDELTFTIAIENTGTVTLDPVTYDDPLVGVDDATCGVAALAPGDVTTCDVTYTVTLADVNAGSLVNEAIATGTPPAATGLPAATDADEASASIVQITALDLLKSSSVSDGDGDGLTEPGDVVTYTLVATNSGTVTLDGVTISDPQPGLSTLTCTPEQPASLSPGQTLECTATYTVTSDDVDNGRIDNVATATGTPPAGAPALADPVAPDTVPIDRVPSIDLTKSITSAPTTPGVGDEITFTFTIVNSGNVTLDPVTVTDPKAGLLDATCGATVLLAGETTSCDEVYVVTQADVDSGEIANAATATGTAPDAIGDVTDTDQRRQVLAQNPSISLAKTAVNNDDVADGELSEGDTLTYVFDIVNDGDVTLTLVDLDDALPGLGAISCSSPLPTTLAPSATTSCTADYTVTVDDVAAGSVSNDATVTGTPPIGDPVGANDSKIVTVDESPSVGLTKSALLPDADPSVDDIVTYEFVVTNTGNVTLDAVTITDPLPGLSPVDCGGVSTLAIGGEITCTATYTITQDDIDNGLVQNTATAAATSPGGQSVTDSDNERILPNQDPDITITKSLASNADEDASGSVTASDTLTYAITIANTGNVTLASITFSDPLVGATDLACSGVTDLLPGETTSCTVSYVVQQPDVDVGEILNTATANGTSPAGVVVTSSDSETVVPAQVGALEMVKGVAANSDDDGSGDISLDDTLTYEFVVTNVGTVTVFDVAVSDPRIGVVTCPDTSTGVAPGDSVTCDATYLVTQDDVDAGVIVNEATVTADPPDGVAPIPPAGDRAITPIQQDPAIDIVKSSDAAPVPSAGDVITYTFELANRGNVTLDPLTVVDPLPDLSPIDCGGVTSLAPGDVELCTATYTVTQADVDRGSIVNTVTATGTSPNGTTVVVDESTLVVPIPPDPQIELVKSAEPVADPAVGEIVTFTFVATNTGTVTLDPVVVTDARPGVSTPVCDDRVLPPDTSTSCTALYTVTQADVDAGVITNDATATGTAPSGAQTSATDSVDVPIASNPAIEITKVLDANADENADGSVSLGDTLTYRFDITNVGDVTLDPVTYSDPTLGIVDATCGTGALAPADTTFCTAIYTVTQADVDAGVITNSATAAGVPPIGEPVTDLATLDTPVEQVAASDLAKTATHDDLDGDSSVDVGETISYTVVLTNTGTVTLTDASVSDPLVDPLVCTQPVTLAPGESLTCTGDYSVTQADVDAGQVANVATGTADPPVSFPDPLPDVTDDAIVPIDRVAGIDLVKSFVNADDDGSDSISVDDVLTFTLTAENTGNTTLTDVAIADPFPFDAPLDCTPTQPATLLPAETLTCSATYTVTLADVDAGIVENTATVTGDAPAGIPSVSDSETVTALLPQNPSLTLAKTASGTVENAGDVIDYTFVVANDGNVTLTVVDLADGLVGLGPIVCDGGATTLPTTLTPGASTTCTASYSVTQDDIDGTGPAGEPVTVVNDATATGNPPGGLPPVQATDSKRVVGLESPSISLTKSAIPPTPDPVTTAGDEITYEFVIVNDGNTTLDGVDLADDVVDLTSLECDGGAVTLPTTLAPSESVTCTLVVTVSQADIDAGRIANTATATGSTPVSGIAVADSDDELIVTPQTVGITVDKRFVDNDDADSSTTVTTGDTLTYEFEVTNTGNVTLADVTVRDAKVGLDPAVPISTLNCNVDVADDQLAPGETAICTVTYQVPQSDVDAGEIANTVTVAGTPPVGVAATDDDTETVSPGQESQITLDKSLLANADEDLSTTVSLGDTLTYQFVVTNVGTVTATAVQVTDPLPGLTTVTCAPTTLLPGESSTCTATYVVTQPDVDAGQIDNTATATATAPPTAPPISPADDAVSVEVPRSPLLTVTKVRTDTTDPIIDGSTLTYTLTASNDGNVTLAGVSLTDTLDPTLDCTPSQPATLAPGEVLTCDASYLVTQADVDAGQVVNAASAAGTPPPGSPPLPTPTPVTVVTDVPAAPALTLLKLSETPTSVVAGDTIVYTFELTNSGNVSLTDLLVDDARLGLVGFPCATGPVDPGASVSCTFEYEVSQTDVDDGQIVNVAGATAQSPTPVGEAVPPRTDSNPSQVTTPLPPAPSITIDKTSDVTINPVVDQVITYSFLVENTGNVTLDPVTVTDPLPNLSAIDCAGVTAVAPGATTTCTATYVVTQTDVDAGQIVNTATVTGNAPQRPNGDPGSVVTDEDTEITSIVAEPALVTTKSLESYLPNGDGTYVVTFRVGIANTGNVTLDELLLVDDVADQFADANVVGGSYLAADGTLTADPVWDGTASSNVLAPGQSLAPGTSGDALVSFTIAPTVDADYTNVATATGTTPADVTTEPVDSPPVVVPVELEEGSISGVVFSDRDGDGLYTPGVDEPIDGATVTLTGTDVAGNPVSIEVTTGVDGRYDFGDLVPGSYVVTETQPTGFVDGTEAVDGAVVPDSEVTDAVAVNLLPEQTTTVDFAEIELSSLSGTVLDTDGNPIEGVEVTLTGVDLFGNPVSVTVTTGADGSYTIDGIMPSDPTGYTLTETTPIGYGDTDAVASAGSAGGTVTDVDTVTGIVLAAATDATGYDFVDDIGSLSGQTFVDVDGDGAFTSGVDVPLAGVEVTLTGTDAAGNEIDVTVSTGADGTYTFPSLLAGSYTIAETQPAGYEDGPDTVGTAGGIDTVNDEFSSISLPPGDDATGYVFAELPSASVGGTVVDTAGNPIAGVVVTLTGTDVNGNPVTLVATTGADGTYVIDGIPPGDSVGYTLTQTQPAGYGDGTSTVGDGTGSIAGPNSITGIVLDATDVVTGYDFVEQLASISGTVFQDTDDDQLQDPDEPGLAGVEVRLTGSDVNGNTIDLVVVTDADGTYTFPDLVGGTYELVETQPSGYQDGPDVVGSAGGSTVGPDTISGIELPGGVDATGYAFTEVGQSISGSVFVDLDGDGTLDPGEEPLAGVTITLLDADGSVVAEVVTGADGTYFIDDLVAGSYTLVETQPAGYGSVTPNVVEVDIDPAEAAVVDFAEDTAEIAGIVWDDSDRDGRRDGGETGVEGVSVNLLDEDGTVVATTTTDADGRYVFDGLLIGVYRVEVVAPTDSGFSEPGVGSDNGDSDVDWVTGISGVVVIGEEACDADDCPLVDVVVDAGLVERIVDVSITGSVSPTSVRPGEAVVFNFVPGNASSVPLTDGVRIVVTVPAGFEFSSASAAGYTVTRSGNTLTLVATERLDPGERPPPFSITAIAGSTAGSFTLEASITAIGFDVDPTPIDNTERLPVTIVVRTTPVTGSDPTLFTTIALLLVVLGGLTLLFSRRRRPTG